jgi:YggT family protein
LHAKAPQRVRRGVRDYGQAAPLRRRESPLELRAMGSFLYFIVSSLLELLVWAIIISAILSWLVAFDVINLRNRFVYNVSRFLDAVTRPVLAPFQRMIPSLGGVDISPIIVILIIQGVIRYLLPLIFGPLINLMG